VAKGKSIETIAQELEETIEVMETLLDASFSGIIKINA